MPPTVALAVCALLLFVLFRYEPAKTPGLSYALWLPLIWLFFIGTRLPSQWLGVQTVSAADAMENGNATDRALLSLLIVLALVVLFLRGFSWSRFAGRNLVLVTFLLFALVSFVWSDFPFIALKRWFRDFGNYLMMFVVLSDPNPLQATRVVLRRFCYSLVLLSIALTKYYPELSRQYDFYSGVPTFVGATTSKNMLGAACLICGVFFLWDTLVRWPSRKETIDDRRAVWLNLIFLGLTLWLLHLAHSATSQICLALGCLVLVMLHSGWGKRHARLARLAIPAGFILFLILAYGFELKGEIATQLGRDPTLTDRTYIWSAVLGVHSNPIVGTGYESFWLGSRLQQVWQSVPGINETHNGYLDIYVNLGVLGLFLLVLFLATSFRNISRKMQTCFPLATLGLAVWAVLLFYNITEAAFKAGLLWMVLLLSAIEVPETLQEEIGQDMRRVPLNGGRLPEAPAKFKLTDR